MATPAELQAFFASNPAFQEEYARVSSLGDRRSAIQWLSDHMSVDPGTRAEFANFTAQGQQNSIFAAHPDIASAFATAKQANPALTYQDFIINWANANPNDPRLDNPEFLNSVGLELDAGAEMPTEQALLEYALRIGRDDIAADIQRGATAQQILASYGQAFEGARKTIAGIYDGSILASEYGASDEARAAQDAALAAQMGTREGALDRSVADLYAAQEPLNAARLDAARTAATAVNLGVQSQRDQIMADFARDGYVGGSTGTDAALARASIGGRQAAADMLGQAKVTNASDMAGIGRYGATERRTLTDFGAGEKRNIADSSAQRRFGLFTNDVARRLASLALPASAAQTEFQVRNMADDYAQSGFNRTMKNLQYFRTDGNPAPTTNPYLTKPVDSGYENLGAGLVSVAGSIGNANNWWSKPSVSNPSGIYSASSGSYITDYASPKQTSNGWDYSDGSSVTFGPLY